MKTKTRLFTICLFVFAFFASSFEASSQNKFKAVLDAGHGGHDAGAIHNGIKEKDVALAVTLEVGKILEKQPDIEVIYTRKTDVFIGLNDRAVIANRANADFFVSIHANGARNTSAYGTETFVLGLHRSQENFEVAKKENQVIYLEENYEETYGGFDPSSPESLIGLTLMQEEYLEQSIDLAALIQQNFTAKNRRDRSVKQGGFLVLARTYMPSVLVELGFLSNAQEAAYLNSRRGQQELAQAIATAIISYQNNLKKAYSRPSTSTTASTTASNDTKNVYKDVTFKVQIAASTRNLETTPQNFKGLRPISKEQEGNLFRYFYGNTSNYLTIQQLRQEAINKGYTSAFIVAYKNGKRVPVSEIVK